MEIGRIRGSVFKKGSPGTLNVLSCRDRPGGDRQLGKNGVGGENLPVPKKKPMGRQRREGLSRVYCSMHIIGMTIAWD